MEQCRKLCVGDLFGARPEFGDAGKRTPYGRAQNEGDDEGERFQAERIAKTCLHVGQVQRKLSVTVGNTAANKNSQGGLHVGDTDTRDRLRFAPDAGCSTCAGPGLAIPSGQNGRSFAAGGSTDLTARVIAENLRPLLGQTFVIDNRPGAAGTIAGEIVAKSTPNGYTFLVASATLLANQNLYKNLPYDFVVDLAPVIQTHSSTNVLVVNPKVPVNTLADFIAHVKSGKNRVNYGTAGHGSSQHLAGALFNHMVSGNMVQVPYKGGAPAMTDLIAGAIEVTFAPLIEALPFIKSGAVKPLGVCGLKRSPLPPNVPAISDLLPGYQSTSWGGIMAPAKTPPDIVNKMHQAVGKVLSQPNVRTHFAEADKEIVGSSPAEFKKFIAAAAERLRTQVRISGAKLE